jgi:hypothetical protein
VQLDGEAPKHLLQQFETFGRTRQTVAVNQDSLRRIDRGPRELPVARLKRTRRSGGYAPRRPIRMGTGRHGAGHPLASVDHNNTS